METGFKHSKLTPKPTGINHHARYAAVWEPVGKFFGPTTSPLPVTNSFSFGQEPLGMTSKRETLSNHLEGSIQWWRTRAPGLSQVPALPPPWPWVKDFLLRTSVSYSVRWGGCQHSMSISRKYLINRQFLLEFLSSFFFSGSF